jgi:hypothetical protein
MQRFFLLTLVAAALCSPAVSRGQTPSREKEIADFYWRSGHPQSALFYVQLDEKRQKTVSLRVGEIMIIGGDTKSHAAMRKAIQIFPGQTLDDTGLGKAANILAAFDATFKAIDSKTPGFKDLLITVKNQVGAKKDAPTDPTKQPPSLEQLIAGALKNNPDIRVAESKQRETEAELNRTRLKVIADLTILHADIDVAQANVKFATLRYERMKQLADTGTIEVKVLDEASSSLAKAKADLATLQARLPYLLGKTAGSSTTTAALIDDLIKKKWLDAAKASDITDLEFLRRFHLDVFGGTPTPDETKAFLKLPEKDRRAKWIEQLEQRHARANVPAQCLAMSTFGQGCNSCHITTAMPLAAMGDHQLLEKYWQNALKPDSPQTDKLRKALDAPMHMNMKGLLPKDSLELLRDKALPDINLLLRAKKMKKEAIGVSLTAPVPVGALLQYLEDELDIVFVLRDYGIVVVDAGEKLPPGAVRVVDFWKHRAKVAPAADPTNPFADPKAKTKPDLTPPPKPPAELRGMIDKVDLKDPLLVQLSIGANAGVQKGDLLEIFRLQPEPRYLGRLRVVEVLAAGSIGRVLTTFTDPQSVPRAGDQVMSRRTEK